MLYFLSSSSTLKKKEKRLGEEQYSATGLKPGDGRTYDDEGVNDGRLERAKRQKMRVKENFHQKWKRFVKLLENNDDTIPTQGESGVPKDSTAAALIKFAKIGHINRKKETLFSEFLEIIWSFQNYI